MGQKFVQSDYAGGQSGSQYPANIDADIKVMARLAASYNPCAEDTPSALKVVVQAGALFVNGALVANASQTVTLATAHATLPRIDRVVIDALTGVASKIDGTANASPVAPAITAGKLPVAQVLVTAAMTIVGNSAITDERVSAGGLSLGLGTKISGGANLTNNTPTTVSFNAVVFDDGGWFVIGTPTYLTVPETGRYRVSVRALFATSAAGTFYVATLINGATGDTSLQNRCGLTALTTISGQSVGFSGTVPLSAGDTLGLELDQITGGTVNGNSFFLTAERVK